MTTDIDLLSLDEAATLLRVSTRTLQRYRNAGEGPAAFRVGPRRVYYKREDVDAWLAKRQEPVQ